MKYAIAGPGSLALLLICNPALAGDSGRPSALLSHQDDEIVAVKGPPQIMTLQRLPNFVGISAKTVGAKGLSMNLVVIPPGGAAEPHYHKDFESAVFLLEGRVETRYGKGLKKSLITEAGDFLFIPPHVPHQPVNLSSTEAARAIVVRNDPNEQEHVILYSPEGD